MKISLNWIFDHIKGDLSHIDVAQLVDKFITTTAEIEGWEKVSFNVDDFTLVEIIDVTAEKVMVHSPEYNKDYTLPLRSDAIIGSWLLINHAYDEPVWATSVMLGGNKEMFLPALDVIQHLRAGAWKTTVELNDYIIDVDNKSINSRPDLWGHRGLAREFAAILDLPLQPLDTFITRKDIIAYETSAPVDSHNPFTLSIKIPELCSRFAGLYLPSVTSQASQLHMVIRLSRLNSRAIDLLVDATNYVMLDFGQPMHAFDADALKTKHITVTRGQAKEKLLLLDGETVELTSDDIVIADGDKAISLAGIMGGAHTGISAATKSVLLESANFDATTIRRTSARHKKRTEASMRFEKSLDPHQNNDAIKRFLFLLDAAGAIYQASDHIVSLGECPEQKIITIKHAFIEARLGILIKPERIVSILEKIAFNVVQSVENDEIVYTITVPSFRSTKDVKIPEDIVEEVGRYIGYDSLPRVMPCLQLRPSDLHKTYTMRTIKNFLSYSLMMHEIYGYSFFDESVLRELAWQPTDSVAIKNPISEHYTRLVTTLQPHLLKAVAENSIHHMALRFFEWGRVWHMQGEDVIEQKSVSGIFFDASCVASAKGNQKGFDFYSGKELLVRMFDLLHMDIAWVPNDGVDFSWCSSHQTAILKHQDKRIGVAGMVNDVTVQSLSPAGGKAFIFELDADYLLEYKRPLVRFESLSKYPCVRRDISMLVSVAVTADTLAHTIKAVDKRIESVTLIDFFTKPDWKDQKAITFHVEMSDKEKTMIMDEVEEVWGQIITRLQAQGAVIR